MKFGLATGVVFASDRPRLIAKFWKTMFPVPGDEIQRLKKLRSYGVLDTGPEETFDRITRLACRLLGTEFALVSLVDESRQWFKASEGFDMPETPREYAVCAETICEDGVLIVEDLAADPRFKNYRYVARANGIRFYAGAPLTTPEGLNVGTLCVLDRQPRELSVTESIILAELAAMVVDLLELRTLAGRATTAEARLTDAIEALPDGFVLYDADDRLALCNRKYREIYSESADLLIVGERFEDIIRHGVARGQYPAADGDEEAWIAERLRAHESPPEEPIEQELPGDRWLRIQERRTDEGGLVGFRFDITRTKRQERELERLSRTDGLTGLINRRHFMEIGQGEMSRADRYDHELSVLAIDIDHFKKINDRFGHAGGDEVLRQMAARWSGILRDSDYLARLGGEEFAVMLTETGLKGAEVLASRLLQITSERPVVYQGQSIRVTVSIGLAGAMSKDTSFDKTLDHADAALYEAKRGGRNRCVRYEPPTVSELKAG